MHTHTTLPKRVSLWLASLITWLFLSGSAVQAQQHYKVLFLGNSYTATNNLPQLTRDLALSAGDTLTFDSNLPGGTTLLDHSNMTASQSRIMAGGWDYVVVQGQSREPIIRTGDFRSGMATLYNQIRQYNACAVVMPYMTWGRKNGDAANCAAFPVMCTYASMDSALRAEYMGATKVINGEVSPVSAVWRYLRENHPTIELYHPDGSHPSLAGSYAAACCFYAAIFKKDPTTITDNAGLDAADASTIRQAAKIIVYDALGTWDFKLPAAADFGYTIGSGTNEVRFVIPNPQGVRQDYVWDFGDGATSTLTNPSHSYASNGTYTVRLTATNCDLQGTYTSFKDTVIQFCGHTPTITYNGPELCEMDTLWTEVADAYQWLHNGVPIPENNQSLDDYQRYGLSGFSVVASTNGCSERSQEFTESPGWLGYFFDAIGNPCAGDTVAFAVLHFSGSLPGSEIIQWYRNNTLLTGSTNEDTLIITTGGTYTCQVVNPTAPCPQDTTAYTVSYGCDNDTDTIVGITEGWKPDTQTFWRLYPNPASETITIEFEEDPAAEQIRIYNSTGQLMREQPASRQTTLPVSDLPRGVYFLRLSNQSGPPLPFIRQ